MTSYSPDISEDLPLNIGNPASSGLWTNNAEDYDCAIGGLPFFLAPTDQNPYQRETAPYRKDQFDNAKEPGEQSLTGWWMRSQSSFHCGTGIKFFDPTSGESVGYRFFNSKGVNVWEKGQVTLLKSVSRGHNITGALSTKNSSQQHLRSVRLEYSVTNKALTSNVATLTTSINHNLSVGGTIEIIGVDSTFNGIYTITAKTSNTISYAKTASNVSSTAVTPNGSAQADMVLSHDEYDADLIDDVGNVVHFMDYNAGTADKIYAICDDGVYAYWITNNGTSGKFEMLKKALNSTSTTGTSMFTSPTLVVTNATVEFIKDRIIMCVNNAVYEVSPTATTLPSASYTNPNTSYTYTSIAASGPAIYTSGHSGVYSTIQKYSLVTSTGSMPTLSQAMVAAELPQGEIVHRIYYYLGYMVIGTNKGVRASLVNDQDGSLAYGPLIFEAQQPVYDFAARDRFIWCAASVEQDPGLVRIDLSQPIEGEALRFAYANDLWYDESTTNHTTAVAHIGSSDKLSFCTAYDTTSGYIYTESASTLMSTGFIQTGSVRFSTLEPKNYKFVRGRGDFTYGAMDIQTVDSSGNLYTIISYNSAVGTPEAATSSPVGPQEYISYKFTLSRSATDTTLGPTFKGYQVKALPATKRQRLIQFPVWCYDVEKDRYNVVVGYQGRAWERIQLLEDIEAAGDIINVQDFTTGERVQALIEKITFDRRTPPNGNFEGFGGLLQIIVRTVL